MELTKRQNQIIEIALNLISERGIQNLTMKNLSGALGISEPAIYRHFENKDAILNALIDTFAVDSQNVLAQIAAAQDDAWVGIGSFIRSRLAAVKERPPLAKVMFAEEIFMDDPFLAQRMMDLMHEHRDLLRGMIEHAQKNGEMRDDIELDMIFRLIMGPVRLLIKQWGLSGFKFNLPEAGEQLIGDLQKIMRK